MGQTHPQGDETMNDMDTTASPIRFTITRQGSRITDVETDSPEINHFLDMVKMSRAYNTWISYAHDLSTFFGVILKLPEAVTRPDCVAFMKQQEQAGCSDATINRRLATVSSLFNELHLLDPNRYPRNPVSPRRGRRGSRQRRQSLYRKQPQRIPDVLSSEDLRVFLDALPSWRDRTLVLLMWLSCLRVSEVVAIRFQDIECSRRVIRIPVTKGNNPRAVFMSMPTFNALNRYLDEERKDLFPDIGHIFVAFKGKARGQPLTTNAVQKMIYYYAEKCGLDHVHAHLFRHTGITQLIQGGMSEPAVRDLVGHRSPDSLLPYLHLCDEFVEKEFRQAQAALDHMWPTDSAPDEGAL
jgi:integrase/recombinase XerC